MNHQKTKKLQDQAQQTMVEGRDAQPEEEHCSVHSECSQSNPLRFEAQFCCTLDDSELL